MSESGAAPTFRSSATGRSRPIAAAIYLAILLLAFGFVAREVRNGGFLNYDRAILLFFREPGNPAVPIGPAWLQEAARDFTSLGSYVVLGTILIAVLGYMLLAGKYAAVWLLLSSVVGGALLNNILKIEFGRPRPDIVAPVARVFTASFPSGHATLSAVVYLTLGALLARIHSTWAVRLHVIGIAVLLTALIGITRIYLGVHYPSDVVAGWCVGGAWALACWALMVFLQQRGAAEQPTGP